MSVLSDELRKVLPYDLNIAYLADDIDALEAELQKAHARIAELEKEPICIYDKLNNTICKGEFINGYGFPCSTCGHASR